MAPWRDMLVGWLVFIGTSVNQPITGEVSAIGVNTCLTGA